MMNPEEKFLGHTESGSSDKKTFTKRPGTTDKGKDYENLMVANLILRLMKDNNTKDFNVWSNDTDFGEFDDVIVEIEGKNGSQQKYALQLKHMSKETKKLSIESLKEKKGNFGINKYFKSFIKSKQILCNFKLILLTTLDSNINDNQEIQLSGDKDELVHTQIIKSAVVPTLNTNENIKSCYKFELVKNQSTTTSSNFLEDYDSFLEIFFLYTNQLNVDVLKTYIVSTMKQTFSCTDAVAEKFLNFISEWSLCDGTKEKLHLEMMQKVIALHLVTPYIRPIKFGEVDKKGKLLQKAIHEFDMCLFKKESVEKVAKLWGDSKDGINNKEISIVNRNYQIMNNDMSNINNEEYTKLLWLINKCPLIVNASASTYEAVKLCKDKKFILIEENFNEAMFAERSIFRKLSDLKHHDVRKDLVEHFKCLLPTREVNLEYLIQHDSTFNDAITTNELVMMLHDPYKIQEEVEELPAPYIARSISKSIVDATFLENIDENILVLISNFQDQDILRVMKKYNPICIDEHFTGVPEGHVYVSRGMFSQEEFLTLCKQNNKMKSFHHFRIWNGLLEWIKSVNNTLIFDNHLKGGYSTDESELWEANSWNNIHLITGNPGLGKSCFLRNLKNCFSSNIFTLIFSPQDMKEICKYLQTRNPNLKEFILDLKCTSYNKFDRCVVQLLFQKNQVMFLWDALDEIVEDIICDNINIISNIIQNFSEKGIVQWLTCRPHMKRTLEAKFCVCSRNILPFTDEQQVTFIKERLRCVCPIDKNLDEIAVKIKNNVALSKSGNVLNIPIQIYMFTEFYIQDNKKLPDLLKEICPLADIYQYFVQQKFNFYYKDKLKVYAMQNNQLRQAQNNHIKQYQKAAMKAILDSYLYEQLNIDCEDFLNDIKHEGDCFGFISEITTQGNKPVFTHISYAEYFVANYHLKRQGAGLEDALIKDRYSNVRFFLDMLLAKN